jgi:hypothetical protein
LYDYADTNTPLATETYKGITCSTGTTVLTVSDSTGIPVGSNVMVSINGTVVTREVSFVPGGTTVTVDSAVTLCDGTTDYVYYRPLQPGTGRLYFGAQTTLGANLVNGTSTDVTVANTDGFAYGDTITFVGYNAAGEQLAGVAVITGIPSATHLDFGAGATVSGAVTGVNTIVFDYLSGTAANAINKKANGAAVVYVGTGANGSINKQITAGTTVVFMVKGDTTGATTNETLLLEIASASDFIWTDSLLWTVNTDTIPSTGIQGGTLTF